MHTLTWRECFLEEQVWKARDRVGIPGNDASVGKRVGKGQAGEELRGVPAGKAAPLVFAVPGSRGGRDRTLWLKPL